jgi:hypothetical protein
MKLVGVVGCLICGSLAVLFVRPPRILTDTLKQLLLLWMQ